MAPLISIRYDHKTIRLTALQVQPELPLCVGSGGHTLPVGWNAFLAPLLPDPQHLLKSGQPLCETVADEGVGDHRNVRGPGYYH